MPDVEIEKIIEKLPSEDETYDLAEVFKVFGDPTRIKILYSLYSCELCVADIACVLNMNQSAISHQLRILKDAALVKCKRVGKTKLYSLDDEHVEHILAIGKIHVDERK